MLMGVYRWYVVLSLIIYSSFSYSVTRNQIINAIPSSVLMSRSANTEQLTDAQCQVRPVLHDYNATHWYQTSAGFFVVYNGCIYQQNASVGVCATGQKCFGDWKPVYAYVPPDSGDTGDTDKPDTKPDDKPGSGDTGDSGDDSGSTGGDTGASGNPGGSSGTTPPALPPVPVKPFPDGASVGELRDLFLNCTSDLSRFPPSNYDDYNPSVDYQYNARARQCNAILNQMRSELNVNDMLSPTRDDYNFITKDGSNNIYLCKPNTMTPSQWADKGLLYPGPVVGHILAPASEREIGFDCKIVNGKNQCDHHLNFNYGTDNGYGTSVCNTVYNQYVRPGDTGHSNPGSGSPGPTSCSPGYHPKPGEPGTCVSDDTDTDTDTGSGDTDEGNEGVSLPSLDVPGLSLAPLWNIWPSARDFKLTLPAAKCPVFNIEVFGTNHQIDTFCTIFTPDIIAIIRAICILTASVLSFIIVLRA